MYRSYKDHTICKIINIIVMFVNNISIIASFNFW